jgi:tRNA/rRNA methyltransferase
VFIRVHLWFHHTVNVRIILVRPRNPVNIGAVARVMANFGFGDLVVVNPYPPSWEEVRRAGPRADAVIRAARVVATLQEAVAGCRLVAGTTSGSRRRLDRPLQPLPSFRPKGKTALVFGAEKSGLDNDDLSYCHVLLRIPTAAATPSMNLAAAVAVCCYEMTRSKVQRPRSNVEEAPVDDVLRLLAAGTRVLETARFLDSQRRLSHLRKLRQIALRARLRPEDVALLTAALSTVEYQLTTGH